MGRNQHFLVRVCNLQNQEGESSEVLASVSQPARGSRAKDAAWKASAKTHIIESLFMVKPKMTASSEERR